MTRKQRKKYEYIERCMCEEEAKLSIEAKGLVPKFPPHHKNPKWIAIYGTRPNCGVLGKRKNYTYKLVFKVIVGTVEWLQDFETKTNEPNSFELPVDLIEEFNEKVVDIAIIKNTPIRKRRR